MHLDVHRGPAIDQGGSITEQRRVRIERRIWELISRTPLESLWNLQGVALRVVAKRTWASIMDDAVFGHAAELGFYFLFALFPTLFCAGSVLGMAAKSAHHFYDELLGYLALVVPTPALKTVLQTFNQTAAAATSGKVTFGSIATVWSASIGISAIQDTLNAVYKIKDPPSYVVARLYAIGLTLILTIIVTLGLASLLGGTLAAALVHRELDRPFWAAAVADAVRVIAWAVATALLTLSFAVIYYWAPGWKKRRWQWLTPGGAVGIAGYLLASLALRFYLHISDRFNVIYGSLGAVIMLLMWFYICGLMLLVGAEINKEIEVAAMEMRLAEATSRGPVPGIG